MTKQEFEERATVMIKTMVNTIANKEYNKLVFSIPPDISWADEENTIENACAEFGEWLDEQLAMWEEDYEKAFIIDVFNKASLEEILLKQDNTSFVCYQPTSNGEELDIWFEIKFEVNGDDIKAKFDVNT